MKLFILFALIFASSSLYSFDYDIEIKELQLQNIPAIHSFSYAQHDGKWLIIGGRIDGLHPRQPFAAFPASHNNVNIFVLDIHSNQVWSKAILDLPQSIKEQFQATNLNFTQDGDILYIAGGYAFSETAQDHITFPYLSAVNVPGMINAVMNGNDLSEFCTQIEDSIFAVTGGHLVELNDYFYIVGGHRFDGRYNAMGHATYRQAYTNQIRKFKIENEPLRFDNYSAITDEDHLRRRDYNLVPQVFPGGELGYMISSGVFQQGIDLPFLYPVDIYESKYEAKIEFNQYLSNYHSGAAAVYDENNGEMHSIFFGGISQYHYVDGNLVKDDQVPFVNTISRVTRYSDNTFKEFEHTAKMPDFYGASSEFILNQNLPAYSNEVIKLNEIAGDTIVIGHILGGIKSSAENPFSLNQINLTAPSNKIYEVAMIKSKISHAEEIKYENPYDFSFNYDRKKSSLQLLFETGNAINVKYAIHTLDGSTIEKGTIQSTIGINDIKLNLESNHSAQAMIITLYFDNQFGVSKKFIY